MSGPSSILIADDHQGMRFLLRHRAGLPKDARYIEARNGAEAIQAFTEHQPSWVIMDIDMPVMGGLTATRAICAPDPNARIIIVTNNDSPDFRSEALNAGAVGFVSKDDLSLIPTLIH